jgi:hypothetical protein
MRSFILRCFVGLFTTILVVGCDGGDENIHYNSNDSDAIQISGAGIKGPLAFADVKIYALNPAFPDFYDETSPISISITNQYAEIKELSVPKRYKPPYILVIDGSNSIDLNTGVAPTIETLITIITDDMLANNHPIFATPLTTLAFHMARHDSVSMPYKNMKTARKSFVENINNAANTVSSAFMFGQDRDIDIFRAPLIINEYTSNLLDQELAVYHRAAVEAFAAKVYALGLSGNMSSDAIIESLALDIYSDRIIDGLDNGVLIGGIDPVVMSQDPMRLQIPNTSYRVEDIMLLMEEERVYIGTNLGPDFLIEEIVFSESTTTAYTEITLSDIHLSSPDTINLIGSGMDGSQSEAVHSSVDPNAPEILFSHDFNHDNLGLYTLDDLYEKWGILRPNPGTTSLTDYETTEIVADPNGTRGKAMSVFFPEGGYVYYKGVCCSGTEWRTPLKQSSELYLSYDVMFEPGFEFSLGGKLPGLYGWTDYDEFIGGGKTPDGYNGWSGRLMWKADGGISVYVYHAAKSEPQWGDNYRWNNAQLIPGKWHTVEVRYVMNTPDVADGRIQAWFDGQPALDTGEKFLFTKTDALSINGLIVTTYFGGDWPSPKNQHVFFDNFVVSTKPITH